jgi:N-acetylmuramoyl-L-alanine amidase
MATAWAEAASAGEVSAVQLSNGATGTRAEIHLQGKGEFKTLALHGPERLVVDLPASSAARGLKLPAGQGAVTSVRTGQPSPGTLRVVFDLAGPITALKPRVENAGDGARLVIEWPGDGPANTVAKAPPSTAPASTSSSTPTGSPASAAPAPSAGQATAALAAQVAQQANAPSPRAPEQAPASPSPQAILNGQPTAQVVPTQPNTAGVTPGGVPYTIATGKPATPAPEEQTAAAAPQEPAPKVGMRAGMRPLIVAIDPGHGGQDSGAVGQGGTYEKNVVLAIGRELARQINATPGMKAYMTRDSDVFIPLNMRARKARAAGADIFVSIHADAAENRAARGSSVYVLSLKGASSQRARWLADKENASDLIGGVALQKVDNTLGSVLLDLAQSGHMRASEDAANHVLDGLKRVGTNHKPNIERANFAVLRTSDMPSMLVETAFISNPDEEKRLKDPAYQRKVASAVLDGVNTYFTRQPPPGTLFAARAQAEAEARSAAAGGAAGAP